MGLFSSAKEWLSKAFHKRAEAIILTLIFISVFLIVRTHRGQRLFWGTDERGGRSAQTKASSTSPLMVLEELDEWSKLQVDFWVRIFSQYDTEQGLMHDSYSVDRVYEMLDLRGLSPSQQRQRVFQSQMKWKKILLSVDRKKDKPETLNHDERRIFQIFAGESSDPDRFKRAADPFRVRFQRGMKQSFADAYTRSKEFLPMMERVFIEEGVPVELTRLPFVESGFNNKALSRIGAVGLWQFMKDTGRVYLRVGPFRDERTNPEAATRAAARLLKDNYDYLQSWPLAVMAYNHGREGVARAVKAQGTRDLKTLLTEHRGPSYGFASRNFYFEFRAAIRAERIFDTATATYGRSPAKQ